MSDDIRWKQRFNNYIKILRLLEECIPENQNELTNKDRLALVRAYGITVQLGLGMMGDYMKYQGVQLTPFPKTVVREAFNKGIIQDGAVWMDAIEKRNLIAHTYIEDTAEELAGHILKRFYPAFVELKTVFTRYVEKD